MTANITWRANFSCSCLHAAEAVAERRKLADAALSAALAAPAQLLAAEIASSGAPANRFWNYLVSLAAGIDNNRELALQTLTKLLGRGAQSERHTAPLAGAICAVENAVSHAFPKLLAGLSLRVGPMREVWEGRGPGLLLEIARRTDERLIPSAAEVIVIHPALGGGGEAFLPGNLVRIEGVLANPHAELPEVIRLAWLIAQLQLDLPCFGENIRPQRLSSVAQFAHLPPVLQAAEELELARFTPELVQTAIDVWRIAAPPGCAELNVGAAAIVLGWWQTYEETKPAWPLALQALDQMLV